LALVNNNGGGGVPENAHAGNQAPPAGIPGCTPARGPSRYGGPSEKGQKRMDEALAGALTTVELDTSDSQRWFDRTARVYQEMKDSGSGDDWEIVQEELRRWR
jgi:surface antigen